MATILSRLAARCGERPLALIRVLVGLACAFVLALLWHDQYTTSRANEQAAYAQISTEAAALARAAGDTVQASIDRFDFALRTAAAAVAAGPEALALQGRIVSEALPVELVLQLFHIDADGYLTYSSLGPAPRNFLGDRDYFRLLAAHGDDRLVISNPVLGRLSNRWSIQFARAIMRNGQFDGVVSIAVSPEAWTAQLRHYRHSARDTLTVLNGDGHFLLRTLDGVEYFGKRVAADRPFLRQTEESEGEYVAYGTNDGIERLFSWIRLPSGLIMAAGVALDDALAPTRAINRWSLMRAVVSSCLVVLACAALMLALARHEGLVRALGEREAYHRKVLDNMAEGIFVIDSDNRIVSINPAFTAITGYPLEAVQGRTPDMLSPVHADARNLGAIIGMHGAVSEQWAGDFDGLRSNGASYVGHAVLSTLPDAGGQGAHRIVLVSDVSERRRKDEEIWRRANFDLLTGLPNRALMNDRLGRMLSQARRHPASVVVLFVDLDRFKPVNDHFGHEVGDLLLYEVARRLERLFRDEDTIARLGGDEFVVLLPSGETLAAAEHSAERIVASLSQPFLIDERRIGISCSVGIARFPEDGEDAATLLNHADLAMYRAKERGRATWST